MKDLKRTIRILAVVILAVSVTSVIAQGRRRPITDPRDATRLDQPTDRYPIRRQEPINSQLFVTGQVSGLAAFRGDVPYGAPDAFRDSVPSAGLSSFRRQSVGLPDIRGGRVLGTAVFRDPSTTVTTAGRVIEDARIRSRRETDAIDGRVGRSLADELYIDATAGYRPIAPIGQDISATDSRGRILSEQYRQTGQERRLDYSTFGGDSGGMLGIVRRQQRDELVRDLRVTGEDPGRLPVVTRMERRDDIPEGVTTGIPETPAQTPREEPPASERSGAFVLPAEGEDVYVDLLVAMRDRRWQGEPESRYRSPREAETLVRPDRRADAEDAMVQVRPGRPVVVRGLAGTGEDLFNSYMSQGQENLRAGRFYDARRNYEMARLVDGNNPLASIGLALASFAAGEPATASFHLHRAIKLFPPIMETRFELAEMAPEQRLREMLQSLDRRLENDHDAQMLMLATFVHLNLDEPRQAREFAERLTEAAADQIARSYAEYVLTGRRPAETDATPDAR